MDEQKFQKAARWLFLQNLSIFPLLQTDEIPTKETISTLKDLHAGVLTVSGNMVEKCGDIDARSVFLRADAAENVLRSAHGRCRYLAKTPEEIRKLDELAAPLLTEGYMEEIAIRVWLNGGGAFTAENIQSFARLIRRTDNLAVRALFLPFDQSGDLPQQAKDAFSLVKKIRSDMPCMLHAFCFEGLLEPLTLGDAELLHTLRMLSSLNDTSLYASFFIS